MNLTIWSEVVAAGLVLAAVVGLALERQRPSEEATAPRL
jgi:hypothetical protein